MSSKENSSKNRVQPDPEMMDALAALDEFSDPMDDYEKEKEQEAFDHYWDVALKHLDATI